MLTTDLLAIDKKDESRGRPKIWVVKGPRLVRHWRHLPIWKKVLDANFLENNHCWVGTRGISQSEEWYLMRIFWQNIIAGLARVASLNLRNGT